MTKVITVTNQKGGTGKTSTSLFLAYGLALRGNDVLLIDLDSQADASFSTGVTYSENKTSLEVLLGDLSITDAIVNVTSSQADLFNKGGRLDLVPASANLATLDIQLVKRQLIDAQYNLADGIEDIADKYDYVIIDTPPAIGMGVFNTLTASDYVIVPTQADIYGLKGLGKLASTIATIKRRSNTKITVLGILLGRYNNRTNFTKAITEMLDTTAAKLKTKVFATKIRESITIKEAQGERKSLFEYAPSAKVTKDVDAFIDELLGGIENG